MGSEFPLPASHGDEKLTRKPFHEHTVDLPQRDASHGKQVFLKMSSEAQKKQTPRKDSEQIYNNRDNYAV